MLDGKPRDRILAAISSFYRFSIEQESEDAFIMQVDGLSDYPEESFTKLVNRVNNLGFVAFTGPEGSERIYIVRKKAEKQWIRTLKFALMLGSVASVIYTGYYYQSTYTGNTSFVSSLPAVLTLFLLPLGLIIAAREIGRFVALRLNGMAYNLPILVPDPIGMGVLGSIAGHGQAYVSRKAMFQSGLFPLVSGFIASLAVVAVGSSLHFSGGSMVAPVNSSFKSVSLPLIYTLLIGKLSSVSATLNLMQYAGWTGIMISALNVFPIGFLDGGLISKSLTGDFSKYISYASFVVLFGLSFLYPPWFVLLLFVLFTGLTGPEPLLSSSKLSTGTRVLTGIALIIFVLSIAPVPYHVIPNNISVSLSDHNVILVNGTTTTAKFNLTVYNLGTSNIAPVFTIQPLTHISVSSSGGLLSSGGHGRYNISVTNQEFSRTGRYNYTVSAYSGTSKYNFPISVLVVNLTNQMSFNNAIPYTVKSKISMPVFLNFSYTSLTAENFSIISFADSSFSYSVTVNNLTFHEKGYSVPFTNLFSILPGETLTVKLTGLENTGDWTVVVLGRDYNAAIAFIKLGGTGG